MLYTLSFLFKLGLLVLIKRKFKISLASLSMIFQLMSLGKGVGTPLAFRCIKSDGGPVPRTLVGVTRIYPVLYRER